jgi:hypothetical protein
MVSRNLNDTNRNGDNDLVLARFGQELERRLEISDNVRRRPATVSTNVRQKQALIARRTVHHCASLVRREHDGPEHEHAGLMSADPKRLQTMVR